MIILVALLYAGICVDGLNNNPDKRIINGWRAKAMDYPWTAMMKTVIHISENSHLMSTYGATIISERWLLTAAHSFSDGSEKRQTEREHLPRENIIEGNYRGSNGHKDEVFHFHVEKVILHPKFIANQKTNINYDIALVKLTGSIPLNDSRVAAVKLPDLKKGYHWPPYNAQCAISGWGCTRKDGFGQEIAHAVWMKTMGKQECNNTYDFQFEWKPEMRFCAKHYKSGGATCSGDSGSGLVCKHGSQYYIVGILSTGSGEPEKLPSFFVRVSYFLDWINHIIQTD
ncbi:hypothetical protein EG68_02307 [Paragonimus skrjabini miyazakii]|uniref:Peptidase S1 domain-containing protein n=1 Tax=Paragonimus skrjabini miyazakii TaxID=59628 RepID=A0A8S9Z4N5_9TREM|nr:hypothetical protein EG68_02307 [Paragonimus skrjabini miyazakii]